MTADKIFDSPVLPVELHAESNILPPVVPVSKLDADEYGAEDLHGANESLSGSGNLNFLMLQRNQTNAEAYDGMTSPFLEGTTFELHGTPEGSANVTMPPDNGFSFSSLPQGETDTERALSGDHAEGGNIHGTDSNFTNSAISSLSATSVAADNRDFRTSTGTSGLNGFDGLPGGGENGTSGVDGSDGTNGNGGPTNVTINEGDTFIDAGDLTELINNTINQIDNITEILDLTEITNNVTDIINNITDILGEGGITLELNTAISQITDLLTDLTVGDTTLNLVDQTLDLTPLTDLTNEQVDLQSLVPVDLHSITSLLGDDQEHRPGDTDIGLGLEGTLGDLEAFDHITDLALNPVEDLVGDLDLVTDMSLGLLDNSNINNANGDTDLQITTGINAIDNSVLSPSINIALDPVEQLLGDVDLNLGLGTNLLSDTAPGVVDGFLGGSTQQTTLTPMGNLLTDSAAPILNPSLEALGDTSVLPSLDINLLNPANLDNNAGDSDLTLNVEGVPPVDVDLGFIEAITGDIDLNLGNVDVPDQQQIATAASDILDQGILTNPVVDTLDMLTGDMVGDIITELNIDLLDTSDIGGTDTDLSLGVPENPLLPSQEINLDAIESITGDIDLGIDTGSIFSPPGQPDVVTDLDLGLQDQDLPHVDVDLLLDPVENITEDINLGSTDIIEIDFVDVDLDPIESIAGDIDIDVSQALDLLAPDTGNVGGNLSGDLLSGTDSGNIITTWPESVLPDAGSLFGDINTGNGGGLEAILPAPVGHVTEGLGGVLDHLGGNSGGGNHGWGGLFG